jgi:conjugative transfer region protein TrbK
MDRSDVAYAAAIVALLAVFMATLSAINRRPDNPVEPDPQSVSNPDDLSAELRRCRALGPGEADEARCQAAWGESRRRFFGRPARPLPPPATGSAAPATINDAPSNSTTANEAVSGGAR